MSDYVFIPCDVISEILTRLPAKAMFKYTCVCKEWYSIITDPKVIKTHLLRHSSDDSHLELIRNWRVSEGRVERVQEIYFLYHDVGSTLTKYRDIDFSVEPALICPYCIVGSCNGVICLANDQYNFRAFNIFLWNPLVKKSIRLPEFRVTFKLPGHFKHMLGFGFDSKTCDYKVLKIDELPNNYDIVPFEVDIYSSITDNWRNIRHSALNLSFSMTYNSPQTLFSGSAHWIVSHFNTSRESVLSFDWCDEVFSCIWLPTSIDEESDRRERNRGRGYEHWILKLVVIRGSLCVVQYYRNRYCVWMMKEYGDSSSWTKILNADLPNNRGFDRLVGIRNNGKLFIEISKSLFTFDPDTLYLTELGIIRDDLDPFSEPFHTVNYMETLGLIS